MLFGTGLFPTHFSTGEKCHARLRAVQNGAYPSRTETINLQGCGLTEIPRELYYLKKLKVLDLSRNKLSSFPSDFAQNMPSLEILFLSQNQFAGVLEYDFKPMKNLMMFAIRQNELTSVASDIFPDSLKWLVLTSNNLEKIGKLPTGLIKMGMSNNKLKAPPLNWKDFHHLELMRLSNNNVPKPIYEAVPQTLMSVKWIGLAENPKQVDFENAPHVKEFFIEDEESFHKNFVGLRLGEGSAGVSYSTIYKGKTVVYKKFKLDLSSDGRVHSEVHNAALVASKSLKAKKEDNFNVLQRIVGITRNPLGVMYSLPADRRAFRGLGKPPSFQSIARDTYPPGKTFPFTVLINVLHDIASALEILHGFNICHGDLYAHNIQHHEQTGRAMLLDLGASWIYSESIKEHVQEVEMRAYTVLTKELFDRASPSLDAGKLKLKEDLLALHKTGDFGKVKKFLWDSINKKS